MIYFYIRYKMAGGKEVCLFANIETCRVLRETNNKVKALHKQDDRHHDGRDAEVSAAHWFEPPLSLEAQYEKKETCYELRRAIDRLTEAQARRIRAYFFQEMTIEEIARNEGVSIRAVDKSLHKGLLNLRKFMKGGINLTF